ncbi:hypothetical protein FJZ31_13295 [Candidatus Poribacteria bacterium]|nr:hypothetical protein [Candidatus Poribacteria bacterium]
MSRVEKFIAELTSLAKDISPEAEIRISTASLEGEDAMLKVIVPSDKFDEADERLHALTYQILLDEGYHIVVMLDDREELAARVKSSARAA